ncbi:hypothetical protein [Paraburkholderia dipogonis]|uniref:hypothetical protein n=1 Tax=Paraburkholderia dipogonis TaxID=1211383 RepID=UPI0038B92633
MTARRRIKPGQWPTLAELIARLEQLPAIKAQAAPAAADDILDDGADAYRRARSTGDLGDEHVRF